MSWNYEILVETDDDPEVVADWVTASVGPSFRRDELAPDVQLETTLETGVWATWVSPRVVLALGEFDHGEYDVDAYGEFPDVSRYEYTIELLPGRELYVGIVREREMPAIAQSLFDSLKRSGRYSILLAGEDLGLEVDRFETGGE